VPIGLTRRLVRFAAVGTASTLTYVALYALLRQGLGLGAQAANLAAAVLRFLLLRSFVFRCRRRPPA
jgi:putative flippase GtrA